jgi:hypothetical protein
MTVLNTANKLFIGSTPVSAAYAGANKVFPSGFNPASVVGLTVWLDASQLALADGAAVSPWTDLSGRNNHGTIVGTPAPKVRTNALNGNRVVRFTMNEGRVRGNCDMTWSGLPAPAYNYTLVYVTRQWGGNVGRVFSGLYPGTNFLVGFHSSGQDTAYDGSTFLVPATAWGAVPTPWKLYGMTGFNTGSGGNDKFYSNGVVLGTGGGGTGLQANYNLSGYEATGTAETCDCEVAEMLLYHHELTNADRVAVEGYLRGKWGLT